MARLLLAKLSVRLLLLVLLALLPELGLTFYWADNARRQAAGRAQEHALGVVRLASANQEELVAETRQLLGFLALLPEVQSADPKTCNNRLGDVMKSTSLYANLGVIARDGELVCSAVPFTGRINLGDRAYFKRAVAEQGFAAGDYQIGRVHKKAAINFGYPVLDRADRVEYVVYASWDLEWLNQLTTHARLPAGTTLTVVDRRGTILVHNPDPNRWTGKMLPRASIIATMLAKGEGTAQARDLDGVERLFGFAPLGGTSGVGNVYVAVGIPTAAAFAGANRAFGRNLAGLGALGLLVFLVAWAGGHVYILRPVNAVVAAARRLTAGDLTARTGLAQSGELGQLMRAFDEMAGSLEQRTQQVQYQLRRQAALRMIDATITTSLDLRVTLHVLLDQVIDQLEVDAADVLLLNPNSQTLDYAAGRGFRTTALQHTLRLGEGIAGRAALTRRLVGIANLTTEPRDLARATLLAEEACVAYYAMPLMAKGKVGGVLEIFHRSPLTPDQEWLDFLETLAGQAAIAIDNATLFADLQRSNVDLALAYDTTIEGWSRALDLRDQETEGHSQRVTEMTLRLAREIGVPEADLVHIRRGALLHDIGKMGIPDRVLFKAGRLTAEEREVMRRHPVYAYELLSPIEYLRPALDIPYCHHEKWDGSGYPRRLRGEQIPLAARIFAVADVWDALRSDRPYRARWGTERARQHIRRQAGKQFDPHVVEVFRRMQREIVLSAAGASS